jgi:hypothetical protein
MTKITFYRWLVVVLVLINASTLFFFLSKPTHHSGHPPRELLAEELKLSGAKKTKILHLQDVHFREKDRLIWESHNLHRRLFQLIAEENRNSQTREDLLDKIAQLHRKIEKMTFLYFQEIHDLCDVSQKKKLEKIMRHVFEHPKGPRRE